MYYAHSKQTSFHKYNEKREATQAFNDSLHNSHNNVWDVDIKIKNEDFLQKVAKTVLNKK